MNNMEKVFSQEDFDEIMANVGSQGESYVTIETKTLAEFAEEHDVTSPRLYESKYNDGYYYRIGDVCVNLSRITPKELIMPLTNANSIPRNVFVDKVLCKETRRWFYQVRVEPDELNWFVINPNNHLSQSVNAYYHTFYKRFRKPGNPDYINILKNQPYPYSYAELENASKKLKEVLSTNLPQVKEKVNCEDLTIVLAPRAKANQDDSYQQLRKAVSEWCVEHEEDGFVDGCRYIIRHTDTPTTHLQEDGEIYPGITKETCTISPNIEGKDILFIDDIYTPDVNIDEDALQAVIDNKPRTITFYSIAKTPKPIK